MHSNKPFASSSEENKQVILEAISPYLLTRHKVLEIASGTGQHAVFFAQQLPHLIWQTSDLPACHPGIRRWIEDSGLSNVRDPITLDVSQNQWPKTHYDALFSANSFHIMSKANVADFFVKVSQVLEDKALLMIYGPFNYHGRYTSDSNAHFDNWLKQQNPLSGIKDFEWCQQLAEKSGLSLLEDITMPQNNRILVWQKDNKPNQ